MIVTPIYLLSRGISHKLEKISIPFLESTTFVDRGELSMLVHHLVPQKHIKRLLIELHFEEFPHLHTLNDGILTQVRCTNDACFLVHQWNLSLIATG